MPGPCRINPKRSLSAKAHDYGPHALSIEVLSGGEHVCDGAEWVAKQLFKFFKIGLDEIWPARHSIAKRLA